MINQLVIVGIGGIGLQHFRAASLFQGLKIHLVDPNIYELKIQKYTENYSDVYLYKDISEVTVKFEMAIVSTNSDRRYEILEAIVKKNSGVKVIILEKFLFQYFSEFKKARNLQIENPLIKMFVNCTKSFIPVFKNLPVQDNFSLEVTGGNWGLLSNSVHFLELFRYVGCIPELEMVCFTIQAPLKETKRAGFYDVNGKLECLSGERSLRLCSYENFSEIRIKFISPLISINANLTRNHYEYRYKNSVITSELNVPSVAVTTQKIIEQFLINGECRLPTLLDSIKDHMLILKGSESYLKKSIFSDDKFPIT